MEIHWPLEQARFSNLDDLQAGARTQCKRPQGRVGHEHRAERCRGRCGARYPFPESNRDRIEGLPEQYYVKPEPKFTAVERIAHAARPTRHRNSTTSRCRRSRLSSPALLCPRGTRCRTWVRFPLRRSRIHPRGPRRSGWRS